MDKKKIDKKAVGRRIREIRYNKNFTLEGFGKLFGADKSNVSKWELGRSLPNKERIKDICKVADITVNELLYGSYEKDIEELYEGLIRLPKDEIINLMERVAYYYKQKGEE